MHTIPPNIFAQSKNSGAFFESCKYHFLFHFDYVTLLVAYMASLVGLIEVKKAL